jgi:hypothetical protein
MTLQARPLQFDPLYVIFDQHLCNFADPEIDRKTFVGNVIQDYLSHLRKNSIVVPRELEAAVIEELSAQVSTMLVKKIYGCLSLKDFQEAVPSAAKRKAKSQYARLKKAR